MAKINVMTVETMLKGMKFPAKKEELLAYAEEHGADQQVCSAIRQLANHHFRSLPEVTKALETSADNSRSSQN